MEVVNYIISNFDQVSSLAITHINLTIIAVVLSIILGVPLGVFISYYKNLSKYILGLANLFQAIPAALLTLLVDYIFSIIEKMVVPRRISDMKDNDYIVIIRNSY